MNNFKEKLNSFFFLGEEEATDMDDVKKESVQEQTVPKEQKKTPTNEERMQKRTKSGGENVVAINQKKTIQKPQITIVEPRLYSEVQEISDHLLENQSIIVNFRRMDHEQATKTIDFLMGVTYAVKGDIQRLGEEIFICTPQSVKVNGSELSEFTESLL